jgi:DNA-binding MarR family transcriptional regulator
MLSKDASLKCGKAAKQMRAATSSSFREHLLVEQLVSLTTISKETIMANMKKIANLEDHLGYWLRYVSNQVALSFKQSLEKEGITVGEWVTLRLLYDGEDYPAALAEKVGVTRGAMSKILDRLYAKEVIDRKQDQGDRRHQKIAITKKGEKLVPILAQMADDNDAYYFVHFTEQEKKLIINVLKKTIEHLQLKSKPLD